MNKYLGLIKDRAALLHLMAAKGLLNFLSDESLLKKKFRICYGYELDLDSPKTFNEKIMWLKLHDRDPLYHRFADKLSCRRFIKERLGEGYLARIVGGPWKRFQDIDIAALPGAFVLKCSHDSGSVLVVRNKEELDIAGAARQFGKALARDYYHGDREWPYKGLERQIFAEELLPEPDGQPLIDYKFLCFGGKVKLVFRYMGVVDKEGRVAKSEAYGDIFDRDFQHMPFKETMPCCPWAIEKPRTFEKMLELAETLSEGLPLLRVDMFTWQDQIRIGELTLYHNAGMDNFFDPPEWDRILGDWIDLSKVKART